MTAFGAPAAVAADRSAAQGAAIPIDDRVALMLREEAGGDLKDFYAGRGYRPIWVHRGKIGAEAATLLGWLESARLDGLKSSSYDVDELRERLAAAKGGDVAALARAELALSKRFAHYVRDQRRPRDVGMIWADKDLKPRRPSVESVLRAATFPEDFGSYLSAMGWMSEHYVRLRRLMEHAQKRGASEAALERIALNLDRARVLPGPWTHHIVVDAAAGLLYYYGGGKREGMMRVVVGAPETQTPMLAGNIQWAILNPYWNVPDYLAGRSIAPKVLAGRSLASLHMEALSDWGPSPRKLDASEIDWHAVAAGQQLLRLRELPGPRNSMGKVKFLFPNDEGIYLHDTPDRALLRKKDRHFSNGCIRLEKASELGKWLFQKPLRAKDGTPEQAVPLPVEVPVYLTYFTAIAVEKGVAFRDVYGRDG
ncbi:L,D-transpeptidase family protein [Sphingopyxis indica]|uniref:L,D-transpeptidase family protein n=1 Tax=Sphingopyxis indica TaxID=436663 RepID=UPI001FEAD2C2|nr:L,D-transpeptidase family protein [Sphingopyxis indica]